LSTYSIYIFDFIGNFSIVAAAPQNPCRRFSTHGRTTEPCRPSIVFMHPSDHVSTCHLPPRRQPLRARPIKSALLLSSSPILLQVQNLTQPISDYNLIQFFHIEMASSSVLLGAAGAAVLTGTSAGKAVPRPSFLAARPRTVTGGRLCLQTPPRASPVCVASVRS
jgi:hypothetical protein